MHIKKFLTTTLLLSLLASNIFAQKGKKLPGQVWSIEKANEWYKNHRWLTSDSACIRKGADITYLGRGEIEGRAQ